MSKIKKIHRQRPRGWNTIRTRVISDLMEARTELVVAGVKYRIQNTIAIGGFSIVYRAASEKSEVALKVVNIRTGDAAMNEMLAQEPQILNKLKDCEYVVKMLDQKMVTSDLMVVVMELGQDTLADILSRGDLSLAEVREHWNSVLSCVENLHSNNIIHCDIKPENFIILDGKMKIIDFGLSVILPEDEADIDVEKTFGTGVYLAPECADSRLSKRDGTKRFLSRISLSVDIWSLGALLLAMLPCLTERPAPEMPLSFIISRLTWEEEDIPGVLEILRSCLQRNPELRPNIGQLRMIKI